jgi:hypothetical protein
MTRTMALKAAAFQKARKVKMVADKAAEAERRRKQWEWDHFEPMVSGGPFRGTREEFDEMYQRAKANHQNIYIGTDWGPPQTAANSRMRPAPSHGFWYTVGQMLGFNPLDKYPSQRDA